jgi:hypothetical protein
MSCIISSQYELYSINPIHKKIMLGAIRKHIAVIVSKVTLFWRPFKLRSWLPYFSTIFPG